MKLIPKAFPENIIVSDVFYVQTDNIFLNIHIEKGMIKITSSNDVIIGDYNIDTINAGDYSLPTKEE